ncbi:hypothetical protein J7643_01940 [bacterium]|nr:hypothetical protein [bacterium]
MVLQVKDRAPQSATGYRGAFRDIKSAERAFCKLQASGFRDDCISLVVNDDCPACAAERMGMEDPLADRLIARGQGVGAIAGSALGFVMMGWPKVPNGRGSLLESLAALCLVGAWALSGAILGALVGAAIAEMPRARNGERPHHRHYVLVVRPPAGMEERGVAVLREVKARLEDDHPRPGLS